jgi:hypothetical protein
LPQVRKYRTALRKLLRAAGRANEPLEFICIVGRDLKDWAESDDRETSRNNFAALDARVILYDELINNAYSAYQEFLTRSKEAGRIYRLIESIDEKIGGEEIADVA